MFIQGHEYIRRDLHQKYGGQRQGGISTPSTFPIIMLFTGESGQEYGYKDGWDSTGDFLYTGEGQTGGMTFVRGNRAIRYHVDDGKDIHLFEYIRTGVVRYIGQVISNGFEIKRGPDLTGNQRDIILFRLMPISVFESAEETKELPGDLIPQMSIEELRKVALGQSTDSVGSTNRTVKVRERARAIKIYVHKRAKGICEACNISAPFITALGNPYLEVHHLRRLSDGGPDHPDWVIGVCPNCHRRSHFGKDRDLFNGQMTNIVQEREKQINSG
jgi:5-methylcytosine-specific restriction enzyme A